MGMSMEHLKLWIEHEERKERARLEMEERRAQKESEERREIAQRGAEDRKANFELEKLRLQKVLFDRHAEAMAMQKAQLDATIDKSRVEAERNAKLTNRIKQTMLALKEVVGMFPSDPVDVTAYFEGLEKTFETFGVADELKSHVLRSKLHEKAKTLVARLPRDTLDNYKELKDFLLKEYQISPLRLKGEILFISQG
jgi:hypothetical protein